MRGIFIFISLFSIFSCKKSESGPTVQTSSPSKKSIGSVGWIAYKEPVQEILKLPGTILANEMSNIHPEISGLIQTIHFVNGQNVQKGQLLIKLNDAEPKAKIQKLNIQIEIAAEAEKRQRELFEKQIIAKQEYDLTLIQLRNLEADLELAKVEFEKHQVKAPFSGTLGIRQVSPGSYVNPASVLVELSDLSQCKIEFAVPEKYIPLIKISEPIYFYTRSNDQNYEAIIEASESSLDLQSRALHYIAKIKQKSKIFHHGEFVEVRINLTNRDTGFMIPSYAILPQARDKKILILKNGVAEFRSVKLGIRDSSRVEILSGLETGDTVLTTGLMGIRPGMNVQVHNILNVK